MNPVNLMVQKTSSPDIPKNVSRFGGPSLLYRILFFLLLSGPPRFRLRDPTDSLNTSLDWVVLLQVIVWGIAGCWLILDASYEIQAKTADQSRLSSLEILSIILIG